MRPARLWRAVPLCCALGIACAAVAQQSAPGRVAGSTAGVAGERQRREEAIAGIEPAVRNDSRIHSRVESRIRNRIDRYYDPQANAVSPFVIAGDQARTAGRSRRR